MAFTVFYLVVLNYTSYTMTWSFLSDDQADTSWGNQIFILPDVYLDFSERVWLIHMKIYTTFKKERYTSCRLHILWLPQLHVLLDDPPISYWLKKTFSNGEFDSISSQKSCLNFMKISHEYESSRSLLPLRHSGIIFKKRKKNGNYH